MIIFKNIVCWFLIIIMTAFPCLASAEAGKNNRKAEAGNKLSFSIIDDANIGRPHAGNKLNFFQHFPGVSVNLRNANLFIEFTDIASRSKPQPMVVTRTYNSRTNYNGQFGWGWASFPSDIRIELDKRSGNIVEYKDDGSFITYFPAGKDSYVNRATSDNLKVMRNKNGMVYIKKSQNDGQWFFNESGHLIKHIDLDDNTLAIKRRGAIIDNVVDSRQKAVRFLYNNRNKIEAIIDSNGKKWQYTYDSKDHLISVQKPDGFTDSFEYDSLHNLVSWNRPGTGIIKMTYDAENDWIIEQKGPEKQHSRYHYEIDRQSPDRSKTTVIDSRGNKDVHIFSGWKEHIVQADGTSYIQRFDERGYPASITDALGNTEKTLYDQLGRLIERVNILGGIARFTYYGQTSRIRSLTDEQGGIWSFSYTKAGKLSELADPKGGKYSFRDNKRGLVESVTFPSGRTYKFKYNEDGHMTSHIDPLGFKSLLSYNNEGSVNRFVDPGGKTKRVRYDASDRIVSLKGDVINPIGFLYDKQGNITGVEGEEGYKIQYGYDGHGNRTSALIPPDRKMQFVYDGLGAITKIKEDGKEVNVVYDNRGRPLRIDFSDRDFLLYEYDAAGNVVRTTNKNRDYSITYRNNLVAEIKDQVTGFSHRYTYDRSGNRTGMEDSSGAKTFYRYDHAKRLVEINNSNVGSISFVYDEDGFLISKEFPNGIQQRHVYDKGGRLVKSYFTKDGSDKNSGDVVMSHAYTYDLSSNVSEIQNYLGEITTYKYDKRSRLISAKYPDGITENFGFTKTGNRMVRGHEDKTLYNTAGQLLEDSVFSYTYNTDGSLKEKLNKKTHQITTYEYNGLGQMTEVTKFTGPNRERKTLGTYQYDGLGRRVKQKGSDWIRNFNYDGFDLISESDEEGRIIARYVFGPGIDQPLAMSHNEKIYYYATDGRGNIMGLIDEKGALVNTYDYRAYGEVFRKKDEVPNPFTYRAREFDAETSLYYYRARYYDPMAGVFTSIDPYVLFGSVSPYRYASWNPITYYDPLGLWSDIFSFWTLAPAALGFLGGVLLLKGVIVVGGVMLVVGFGGTVYSLATTGPSEAALRARINQLESRQLIKKDPKTGQYKIEEGNMKLVEGTKKNKNFRKGVQKIIDDYNKENPGPGQLKPGPGSGPPAKQTPPPVKPGPGSGPPAKQPQQQQPQPRVGGNVGAGAGANVGVGAGAGAGANVGGNVGAGAGVGAGANVGVGAGAGARANVGGNVGAGAGAGAGANVVPPPPPRRGALIGWGPNPRTITVPCDTIPTVNFSFVYLDYNDPHGDGWAEDTIANCEIGETYKRPGTYQVTCTAKSTRNHVKESILELIVKERKGGCNTGQTPSIFGAPIFPSKCGPGETHNTQGECVKVSSITEIHSQLGAKERSHIESRGQRENIDVENQWRTGPKQSQGVEKWTKAYVASRVKKKKEEEEPQKPSSPEGGNGASTSGEAASSASSTPTSPGTTASSGSSTPTKPGSQPAEEFDWGQTLPYPAYIYHVTKTYTYSGSFDRDMYLCHKAEKPDANGQIHDSLGHYQASKVAGPLTTPKAICEAYSGLDPAKGRAPGGWAGVNFNCGAYSPK